MSRCGTVHSMMIRAEMAFIDVLMRSFTEAVITADNFAFCVPLTSVSLFAGSTTAARPFNKTSPTPNQI